MPVKYRNRWQNNFLFEYLIEKSTFSDFFVVVVRHERRFPRRISNPGSKQESKQNKLFF